MPATTTTTFEYVIRRHRRLLAVMLDKKIKKTVTPEKFVDHVDSAVVFLSQSVTWNSERESMEAVRTYLSDAFPLADDDPAKAVLIGKADEYLSGMDETDFLC